MASRLKIKVNRASDRRWDPERALANALAERNRFLEQYPHQRKLQAEIDRVLEKAGSPENRMAVLAFMLESRLTELQGHLQRLNRILMRSKSVP